MINYEIFDFIFIDDKNFNTLAFGEPQNYFGSPVSTSLIDYSVSDTGLYLLTNTEFKVATQLLSVEFYVTNPGLLRILVINILKSS